MIIIGLNLDFVYTWDYTPFSSPSSSQYRRRRYPFHPLIIPGDELAIGYPFF